jgi:hypothetical protein
MTVQPYVENSVAECYFTRDELCALLKESRFGRDRDAFDACCFKPSFDTDGTLVPGSVPAHWHPVKAEADGGGRPAMKLLGGAVIPADDARPRCTGCGNTIDQHPRQAEAAAAFVRAHPRAPDPGWMLTFDQAAFSIRFPAHVHFLASNTGPMRSLEPAEDAVMRQPYAPTMPCVVCGQPDASLAHLLKNPGKCEVMGVGWDATNFIALCGPCRDLFERFRMSFIHESGRDRTHWLVAGGGSHHDGKRVSFPSRPHRRVVHGHLAHALLNMALDVEGGAFVPPTADSSDSESDSNRSE